MAGEVTVKISGLEEIQQRLETMVLTKVRTAIKDALESGALLILKAMRSEAPKDTGFLEEHFDVKYHVRAGGLTGYAHVGPQGHMDYPNAGGGYVSKTNRKGHGYKSGRVPVVAVARWLEFGTMSRERSNGGGTGRMTANPFITRAFESVKEAVISRVVNALREGIGL